MTGDQDQLEAYYADKLWNLLPAVYRALDTDQFNTNGPLRELVNRIGAQAAVLRRSIDRMWEDQSIETCDDWVIPYIGDLWRPTWSPTSTPRGQRLDVAKTIYYRRRKGTLAILEEIAADITGWNAKVVEFFRRLGRTRHGLDPAIGISTGPDGVAASPLQLAQGLIGSFTQTSIGGFADLRNAYGASKVGIGVRRVLPHGRFPPRPGERGLVRHPPPGHLPLAVAELRSRPDHARAIRAMSQPILVRPDRRDIPLFGIASRQYGNQWTSPSEWQLPTPISPDLLALALTDPTDYPLYAVSDPVNGSVIPNAAGRVPAGGGRLRPDIVERADGRAGDARHGVVGGFLHRSAAQAGSSRANTARRDRIEGESRARPPATGSSPRTEPEGRPPRHVPLRLPFNDRCRAVRPARRGLYPGTLAVAGHRGWARTRLGPRRPGTVGDRDDRRFPHLHVQEGRGHPCEGDRGGDGGRGEYEPAADPPAEGPFLRRDGMGLHRG